MAVQQLMLMDAVLEFCYPATLLVVGGGQVTDDEFLLPDNCVFCWFVHVLLQKLCD